MGKALYRKYRSKSLAEIIGQEHITQALDRALKQGMTSHAYLFTGPRGTGKTSIARILAHEVNKLPYSEQSHLDIIEIDAASNRRIDEIRELRERVHTAPTSAQYKVYIIDEVHMLTKEAFNALLKTLEEPPEHVIFILATTEAHKVPETIVSRTQRFTFKPVTQNKVAAHLKDIAKKEKVNIDDDALELIAAHGEGSFRDSISLLDQLRHSEEKITLKHVQQAVGQAPDTLMSQLIACLDSGSLADVASTLTVFQEQGIQPPQVARQLSAVIRQDLLKPRPIIPIKQSLKLLHELVEVSAAKDPGLALELAIYSVAISHPTAQLPLPESKPTTAKLSEAKKETKVQDVKPKNITKEAAVDLKPNTDDTLDSDSWSQVLSAIKAKHNTLYGIARMAIPTFEPGKLTLSFAFAFHQKRLDDSKNKQLLTKVINEVTGNSIKLICILDPSVQGKTESIQPKLAKENPVDLEAISNIFGSAEVVE